MLTPQAGFRGSLAALLLAASASAPDPGLSAIWAGIGWGEPSAALVAHFGARATVLPSPIDFGDSYANVVIRDLPVGGVPLIAFFEMDKRTGGLKRVQLERPRHGVNPPAFRAVLGALVATYGSPEATCVAGAGPQNGYQAASQAIWRHDDAVVRAVFRDTTIEAFEGCLYTGLGSGPCGLTGQLIVRISPPGPEATGCQSAPR